MNEAIITGLFTIVGVLLGVFLAYVPELWKSVTMFGVSCRIVKFELEHNEGVLKELLDSLDNDSIIDPSKLFLNDGWKISMVNVALLLPESVWTLLSAQYTLQLRFRTISLRDEIGQMTSEQKQELREVLRQMAIETRIASNIIGQMEVKPLFKLFLHAIKGKPITVPAMREMY